MTKRDILGCLEPQPVIFDELDDALVGVAYRHGWPAVALYDIDKIVEMLMAREGLGYEEAIEYFEFNIANSSLGETTPAFVRLFDA